MDKIAVLIPCFNESKTIGKVIEDFRHVLPEAEIYVYDNNSSDNTVDIARRGGAIVRHESMQGKGNVIRRMFREVDAECYIMVDGDDTYPAESAREMVEYVFCRQADMVVGDRLSSTYFSENKRLFHNSGNTFVRWLINRLFNTDIKDIMTGYRAFGFEFVKSFPVLSKGFEIETEMSIHAADKNMHVENVVIEYRDRPNGSESKLDTFSDGRKVIFTIIKLLRTYKPMTFFSVLTMVLSFMAFIFMIPVVSEYLETGLVERFPTLIVCGFVFLTAIVSLFSGWILETITWKNRQDFEMLLHKVSSERKARDIMGDYLIEEK